MTKKDLESALNILLVGLVTGDDLSIVLPEATESKFSAADAYEDEDGSTVLVLPETTGGKRFRILVEEVP